jgi:hypothetical protein
MPRLQQRKVAPVTGRMRKALLKIIEQNVGVEDGAIVAEDGMRFVYRAHRKDAFGNQGRWEFVEEI